MVLIHVIGDWCYYEYVNNYVLYKIRTDGTVDQLFIQ